MMNSKKGPLTMSRVYKLEICRLGCLAVLKVSTFLFLLISWQTLFIIILSSKNKGIRWKSTWGNVE